MVAETKLYDALSIKPEATQDEIKKAYRFANSVHHKVIGLGTDFFPEKPPLNITLTKTKTTLTLVRSSKKYHKLMKSSPIPKSAKSTISMA